MTLDELIDRLEALRATTEDHRFGVLYVEGEDGIAIGGVGLVEAEDGTTVVRIG